MRAAHRLILSTLAVVGAVFNPCSTFAPPPSGNWQTTTSIGQAYSTTVAPNWQPYSTLALTAAPTSQSNSTTAAPRSYSSTTAAATSSAPRSQSSSAVSISKRSQSSSAVSISKRAVSKAYSDAAQRAWGGLCTHGKLQSPIAIDASTAQKPTIYTAQKLFYTRLTEGAYKVQFAASQKTKIVNDGYKLNVFPMANSAGKADFGNFNLPAGTFDASAMHFHFPAEHQINDGSSTGTPMVGEMQIMFKNLGLHNDGILGLSLLLNAVATDKLMFKRHKDFFESLMFKPNPQDMEHLGNSLPSKAGEELVLPDTVDLFEAFQLDLRGNYYHYTGSLTSPPCTENVPWYVMKKPINVTLVMLQNARDAILQAGKVQASGNNRQLQPSHNRDVILDALAVNAYDQVLGSLALTTTVTTTSQSSTTVMFAPKIRAIITSTTTSSSGNMSNMSAVFAAESSSSAEGSLPAYFYEPSSSAASSGSSSSHSSAGFTRLAAICSALGGCCFLLIGAGAIAAVFVSKGRRKNKARPKKEDFFTDLTDLEEEDYGSDYDPLTSTQAITTAAPSSSYYQRPL